MIKFKKVPKYLCHEKLRVLSHNFPLAKLSKVLLQAHTILLASPMLYIIILKLSLLKSSENTLLLLWQVEAKKPIMTYLGRED